MLCPILSAPTARTAFTEHFADVNCLKEECAWWQKEMENCIIYQIGMFMGVLASQVDDIGRKMPHLEQFKRA